MLLINNMPNKKCNENAKRAKDPLYICNPQTGRWVLKTGAIGRNIVPRAARPAAPAYVPAPVARINPPAGAQGVGLNDFMRMLAIDQDKPRDDGFYPRDNVPEDPEIVYIEKDTGFVWAKDVFNKIVPVKNTKMNYEQWKPICKLIPKNSLKNYDYFDLAKIANACKIPKDAKKPKRTKRALYNLIDWNNKKACSNDFTFMGDAIGDIPAIKIIRINDVCYNVDDVVQNLISTKGKNVDMYNKELKYWTSGEELDDIVKTHQGLDPDLKKEYNKILIQKTKDLKLVFKSKDTLKILGNMARAGWASASDNPFNHAHDPNVFQMSQKSLGKLIDSVNKSSNKDIWLNITSPQGIILGDLIKNLSSTCIHGVGFKLMGLYIYLIGLSRKLKVSIKLSDLFYEQVKDKDYVTFDIYSDGGSGDKLNKQGYKEKFRYVLAKMEEGRSGRADTEVTSKEQYDKFLKAGIAAQKMITKQ